jgi:hypothetical protein
MDATRSSRFTARDQFDRDFQKTTTKKRMANKRVPKFSCMKDNFMWKLQNNLAHTFTYFVNLRF